jgi:hypothetical protein
MKAASFRLTEKDFWQLGTSFFNPPWFCRASHPAFLGFFNPPRFCRASHPSFVVSQQPLLASCCFASCCLCRCASRVSFVVACRCSADSLLLVEAMAPPNNKKRASSSSSPSKSKRVATATATATAKKSVGKKPVAKSLSSHGFSSSKQAAIQIGTKVLLDNSIYVEKCPAEVKKHWFVYEVVELNENGKSWKVLFKEQVVREGGDKYWVYKEGMKPQVHIFLCCVFPVFVFLTSFFIRCRPFSK